MDSYKLGLIVLTLAAVARAQPSVVVDMTANVIQQGDDVTINCHVTNFAHGDFIHWNKQQGGQVTLMGTNNIIAEPFFSTGRYRSDVTDTPDEVLFSLHITGAQAEDSGSIGCKVVTADGAEAYSQLDVEVAVQALRLQRLFTHDLADGIREEYEEGAEVYFDHQETYYFRCIAEGSSPAADMSVTIGGLDITDLFVRGEEAHVHAGEVGLGTISYDTYLVSLDALSVSFEQNTLPLTCQAGTSNTEPKTISIKPVLQFPPQVECEQMHAVSYEHNVNVRCVVRSDPPPEELVFHWTERSGEHRTLRPGHHDNHYTFKVEKGATTDERVAVLNIDRAVHQVFRRYELTASNKIGQATGHVELQEIKSGRYRSDGPRGGSTVLLVIFSTILPIFKVFT